MALPTRLKGTGCVTGLDDLAIAFGGRKLTTLERLVEDVLPFKEGVSLEAANTEVRIFTAFNSVLKRSGWGLSLIGLGGFLSELLFVGDFVEVRVTSGDRRSLFFSSCSNAAISSSTESLDLDEVGDVVVCVLLKLSSYSLAGPAVVACTLESKLSPVHTTLSRS